jgi:hypothetical protein
VRNREEPTEGAGSENETDEDVIIYLTFFGA